MALPAKHGRQENPIFRTSEPFNRREDKSKKPKSVQNNRLGLDVF
jgi:hypothetical protein